MLAVWSVGAIGTPAPAHAERGSCEFRVYSAFGGRSVLACQAADDASKCALFPGGNQKQDARGQAESTASSKLRHRAEPCDVTRAVGACMLPSQGTVYFYEGTSKGLAVGCGHMHGEWIDLLTDFKARSAMEQAVGK